MKCISWNNKDETEKHSRYNNEDFIDRLWKNLGISNFMQIRPVGAELFYADGRTDMAKLIFALRSFTNEPKNKQITYSAN